MNVCAWDPSSTGTGWAIMPLSGELNPVASGLFKRPESWNTGLRLRCLSHDVRGFYERLSAAEIARIVVEIPGTAQAGRKRSQYATSGSYAAAVGIVLAESWRWAALNGCKPVVCVASDHWTKLGNFHGVRKDRRLDLLQRTGAYDAVGDRGGDRGDAINLGAWYAWNHGRESDNDCKLWIPAGSKGCAADELVLRDSGPQPKNARWKP